MSILDPYYAFIDKECADLMLKNLKLKANAFLNTLDKMASMSDDEFRAALMEGIADTPLFDLAEDWVAEQVNNVASNLVNTATDALSDTFGGPLAAARNAAFSVITSAMMFQQELIFYFALKNAEEILLNIREEGVLKNLQNLLDSVRKLHNALMSIAASGDYFSEYFSGLREALSRLVAVYNSIERLSSGFVATERMNTKALVGIKEELTAIAELILPTPPKPDAAIRTSMGRSPETKAPVNTGREKLDSKVKDLQKIYKDPTSNVKRLVPLEIGITKPSDKQFLALQAMWQIPKLVLDMLASYDKYALYVFKLNTLLTSFMGITAPKIEMFSFLKTYITKILDKTSEECLSLIHDMAFSLNGSEGALDPIAGYEPSIPGICARTPLWGLRVKGLNLLLEGIDINALNNLNQGDKLAKVHADAVKSLQALDNVKGTGVLLRRADGKEEVGDLEPHILTLASQASIALVDKTQFAKSASGQYRPSSVITASNRAMSRVQLSIDSYTTIAGILDTYISQTKSLLTVNALGDSLLNLCDQFGMDKLKDNLTSGKVAEAFKMGAQAATYVGSALAAINALKGLLSDETSQQCLDEVANDMKTQQRSKELQMSRTASNSAKEQIKQNDETCSDLRKKRKKLEQCAEGGGFSLTHEAKTISEKITDVFQKLLGGDVSPTGAAIPPMAAPPATTTTFADSMIA